MLIRRFKRHVGFLIATMLLAAITGGCAAISTATPTPMPTPPLTTPQKQPEPQHPLVQGEITGLPDDVLATIYVRLPSGRVILWGERGNGHWEFVVTASGEVDRVVTAEAEGFISSPISYTIRLSGTTAYVVEEGQVTTREAVHLDFHFEPVNLPE